LEEPDKLRCFATAPGQGVQPRALAIRNDHDAEDLVQEACLRALKSFDGFRGGDPRAWLLTIVRNRGYTWLEQNRLQQFTTVFDEEIHTAEEQSRSPEALLLESVDARRVKGALEELPL
jgi:RNA polymerase sigma-70 factor (ECF subfamily)